MGTLVSTITANTNPINAFGQDRSDMTLRKSFEEALYLEAKKNLDVLSKSQKKLRAARQASQGILRDATSEDLNEKNVKNHRVTKPAPKAHATATSRLPTRSNHAKHSPSIDDIGTRSKNAVVDVNENPVADYVTGRSSAGLSKHDDAAKQFSQSSVKKPDFQSETWPTMPMIHEQLSKHKEIPSTVIFARFFCPGRQSIPYVDIRYSISERADETFFDSSAALDTLVVPIDGLELGNSKEDEIKYFMAIFKSCINNLRGQIWWNGFSIITDKQSKNRLKITGFEVQPSQLLFELNSMKDLKVHHAMHHVELRGEIAGQEEEKYIRLRGAIPEVISVTQPKGNWIIVHIPQFTHEYIAY